MLLDHHTEFESIKRFPDCQLTKDVECEKIEPNGHVNSGWCGTDLANLVDELIDLFGYQMLLLFECSVGKSAR